MEGQRKNGKNQFIQLLFFLLSCCGLFALIRKKISSRNIPRITSFTFKPGLYYQFNWSKNEEFDRIFRSEFIRSNEYNEYLEQISKDSDSELSKEAKNSFLKQIKYALDINDDSQDADLLNPDNYEVYYGEIKTEDVVMVYTEDRYVFKYKPLDVYIEQLETPGILNGERYYYKKYDGLEKDLPLKIDNTNYYSILTSCIERCKNSKKVKIRELLNHPETQEAYINKEDPELSVTIVDRPTKLFFNKFYTVNVPINTDIYMKTQDPEAICKFPLIAYVENCELKLLKNRPDITFQDLSEISRKAQSDQNIKKT